MKFEHEIQRSFREHILKHAAVELAGLDYSDLEFELQFPVELHQKLSAGLKLKCGGTSYSRAMRYDTSGVDTPIHDMPRIIAQDMLSCARSIRREIEGP